MKGLPLVEPFIYAVLSYKWALLRQEIKRFIFHYHSRFQRQWIFVSWPRTIESLQIIHQRPLQGGSSRVLRVRIYRIFSRYWSENIMGNSRPDTHNNIFKWEDVLIVYNSLVTHSDFETAEFLLAKMLILNWNKNQNETVFNQTFGTWPSFSSRSIASAI